LTSVKLSWVTLDRIVSKEALSDEAIRRQLEQNARPLRSHTASMGDEDLLVKLRGLGVDADREKLAKLCEGALPAATALHEHLTGPVAGNPHRLGKPLEAPCDDVWTTRRGDYRALYSIDDRRQPSLSWRLPTAVTPTSHGDVQPHPAAVSRPIGTPARSRSAR
jgi:mRNA-degrading endonuclease RelE of RelBE toxin-antitoxin system